MAHLALALAMTASAAAVAQSDQTDPKQILVNAIVAISAVSSGTYDGRMEFRSGGNERVITGKVYFERFHYTAEMGGKIAILGESTRSGSAESESFHVAFDGDKARRHVLETSVVLEAPAAYGAAGLFSSVFGTLHVVHFLSPIAYSQEQVAPMLAYAGTKEIDGVPCYGLDVQTNREGGWRKWYFGIDDFLPRRREETTKQAGGNWTTAVLTLSNLEVNVDIDPSVFEVEVPDDATLESVGRTPPPAVDIGDPVPDWTLKDGDGHEHSLSDYKGKLLVLCFWSSWCPRCQVAMPFIQELQEDYADRGVTILAMNGGEKSRSANPAEMVKRAGHTYRVLLDANKVAKSYGSKGIPSLYVIGPDGKLLYRQYGIPDDYDKKLSAFIASQLK